MARSTYRSTEQYAVTDTNDSARTHAQILNAMSFMRFNPQLLPSLPCPYIYSRPLLTHKKSSPFTAVYLNLLVLVLVLGASVRLYHTTLFSS